MTKELIDTETLPIDQLEAHPNNPNRMSGAMFAKLKENINRFGVYKPIRVRKIKKQVIAARDLMLGGSVVEECQPDVAYQIVGGHQTVAACRELGIKEVPAIVMELNDYEALQLMLNDNEIHGEHDPLAEARALEQMAEHRTLEEIAEDTVHSKEKLEAFKALLKKEEKRAVSFTANKEAASFFNIEATFSGEDALFVKKVFNQTGMADQSKAILELCKHFFKTLGEETEGARDPGGNLT